MQTEYVGVVFAELFTDAAPRAVSNFEQLLTGKGKDIEKTNLVGYAGSTCHRVLKDFIIQW